MGHLGSHGSPPHTGYLRALSWVPFCTLFTLLTLPHSLLDAFAALTQLYTDDQLYADDVQAYLHCTAFAAIVTARVMASIMMALEVWVSLNRLRLNSAKTQFIWVVTR